VLCIPAIIPTIECTKSSECLSIGGFKLVCAAGVCVPEIPGLPVDLCTSDDDCKADEQCLIAVCAPKDCNSSKDCPKGQACTLGFCLDSDQPIPQPGQCQTDADCKKNNSCVATICLPFKVPAGLPDFCGPGGKCPKGKTCQFGVVCL